jgi:hypothetical protein
VVLGEVWWAKIWAFLRYQIFSAFYSLIYCCNTNAFMTTACNDIRKLLAVNFRMLKNPQNIFLTALRLVSKIILHLCCYEHINSHRETNSAMQESCSGLFCPGTGVKVCIRHTLVYKPGPQHPGFFIYHLLSNHADSKHNINHKSTPYQCFCSAG